MSSPIGDTIRHDLFTGARRADSLARHVSVYLDARMTPAAVAAFVVLAGIGIAVGVLSLFGRNEGDLDEMLRPYQLMSPRAGAVGDTLGGFRPLLKRAGDLLVALIEARGLRPTLERQLARSGLAVTSGEFLVVAVIALVVMTPLGGIVGHVPGLVLGVVLGGLGPWGFLTIRVNRRQRDFSEQLPDVLKLLASSLRAGFSLLQCLGAVTEQSAEPMRSELQGAMARIRLGEPVEEALEDVAARIGSQDFHWTVLAIRIQREVGGNLATILDTVAETMVERERIRREVRTLTAEGRASAAILAALPVALAMFIFMANRPYLDIMLTATSGQIALLVGIVMELFGGWWMHKTIQVEV